MTLATALSCAGNGGLYNNSALTEGSQLAGAEGVAKLLTKLTVGLDGQLELGLAFAAGLDEAHHLAMGEGGDVHAVDQHHLWRRGADRR